MYFLISYDSYGGDDDIRSLIYMDNNGTKSMYSVFNNIARKTNMTDVKIDNYLRFNPYLEVLYEGEEPPKDIKFE